MGLALDALDGITLAQLSLSTSKVLRKKHRVSFALRLHHALHLFIQAHDAIVVAPDASSPPPALVFSLEYATTLLHITPPLLQSSDG